MTYARYFVVVVLITGVWFGFSARHESDRLLKSSLRSLENNEGCSEHVSKAECAEVAQCKWNAEASQCVSLCQSKTLSTCESKMPRYCCWDDTVGRCRSRVKTDGCGRRNYLLKCATLSRDVCLQTKDQCVWYEQGGCREPCRFEDATSCRTFNQACEWRQNACIQRVYETQVVLQVVRRGNMDLEDLLTKVETELAAEFSKFKAEFRPEIETKLEICVEGQSTTVLCRRFMHYVNKDIYKSNSDKSRDITIAATLKHCKLDAEEIIGELHRTLRLRLKEKDISLTDFHSAMDHSQSGDNYAKKTKPNILLLMADDMGWGDVGYQSCKVSDFEVDKDEKICSPYELTPNLNIMSKSENTMVFNRFYTAPLCGPSRASFLTGREPIRECMLRNVYKPYDPPELTPPAALTCVLSIAEVAKKAGSRTFFAGKWHVGKLHKVDEDGEPSPAEPDAVISTPGHNGFEEWYATPRQGPTYRLNCGCFPDSVECHMGPYNWTFFWKHYSEKGNKRRKYMNQNKKNLFSCENYWYFSPEEDGTNYDNSLPSKGGWPEPILKDDSEWIVDRFEHFLDRDREATSPFFAMLWFHSPHGPFVSPPEYVQRARELALSLPNPYECGRIFDDNKDGCEDILDSRSECEATCLEIKTHFYGSTLALDAQVGRIRQMLKDRDLADDTLIVFSSDNGPARFDASRYKRYIGPGSASQLFKWKFSYHEGGIRVPMLVEYPRLIQKNVFSSIPATSVDLVPTTMELLGYIHDGNDLHLDGVSLVPQLSGGLSEREKAIVIVNTDRDIHFIKNNRSIAEPYKDDERHFEFEHALNKLRPADSDDEVTEDRFKRWKRIVFEDSECKSPDFDGGDVNAMSIEYCLSNDYMQQQALSS